ncbi:MAG: PDZ domain-containing protein [bacterium]|nr:PDZ domain-containing protein [bacterium]
MKKLVTILVLLLLAGVALAEDKERIVLRHHHMLQERTANQVKADDDRGFLGVRLAILDHHGHHDDDGIHIQHVIEGGAAEAAGIKDRDRIVAIDGVSVTTGEELNSAMDGLKAGHTVSVTVEREGQEETLGVTLRPLPQPSGRWAVVVDEKRAYFGVHIEDLRPQLADYFGVEKGILITEVMEDGPAAAAGLKAGDIVTSVEGETVRDSSQLHKILSHVEPGDEVETRIQRRGAEMTLFVVAGSYEDRALSIDVHNLHELVGATNADGNVEIVVPHHDEHLHLHSEEDDD